MPSRYLYYSNVAKGERRDKGKTKFLTFGYAEPLSILFKCSKRRAQRQRKNKISIIHSMMLHEFVYPTFKTKCAFFAEACYRAARLVKRFFLCRARFREELVGKANEFFFYRFRQEIIMR